MNLFRRGSTLSRLAAATLLIFGIGGTVAVGVHNYLSGLTDLKRDTQHLKNQIARLEQAAARQKARTSAVPAQEDDVTGLMIAHHTHARGAAALQSSMRDLVAGSGATLSQITVLPETEEKAPAIVSLRIQFSAEETTFIDVLRRLETHRPALVIDEIETTGLTSTPEAAATRVRARVTVTGVLTPGEAS